MDSVTLYIETTTTYGVRMTTATTREQTEKVPAAYRGAAERAPRGVKGGAYAADIDGGDDIVVFMIGMRINRLRKVRSWAPVILAMPRMLVQLSRQPDSPLLDVRTWISGRDIMTVQYWRSAEELGRYARDADSIHAQEWRRFNQRIAATSDVGIWHETYAMSGEQVETLYGNMPAFGMARAHGMVSAASRRRTKAVDRVHGAAGDLEIGELG